MSKNHSNLSSDLKRVEYCALLTLPHKPSWRND